MHIISMKRINCLILGKGKYKLFATTLKEGKCTGIKINNSFKHYFLNLAFSYHWGKPNVSILYFICHFFIVWTFIIYIICACMYLYKMFISMYVINYRVSQNIRPTLFIVIFLGSGAYTEELLTFFQQP